MEQIYDVVVVGGGINGCGCAADAALRGLSVLLCEKDDLASKTSSHSSKLIHGGLRYLEHFDFSLVKHAIDERQRLLHLAPHLVHPLPFVLPLDSKGRSATMISIGLFLYEHLSRINKLPKHKKMHRASSPGHFSALNSSIEKGYLFYDCQTDDARLVITNALQAQAHGAKISTHTALISAQTHNNQWHLTLKSKQGEVQTIKARALINASGAFVQEINQLSQISSQYDMTWLQGSHLIVPKLYAGDHAYILQTPDKRIVFTIPYHNDFTLIGTTETIFQGDPNHVTIASQEIEYLCNIIKYYFNQDITPDSFIATSSGIRTLVSAHKNPTALSRDYAYEYSNHPAPAVSILSGKITTYRKLSQLVVDELAPIFPLMPKSKTATTPLIGAHFENKSFTEYKEDYQKNYLWLEEKTKTHYLTTYGTLTEKILLNRYSMSDLGIHFGNTLYQAEVDYLMQEEWAQCAEDILWRRTKLGLRLSAEECSQLESYMEISNRAQP